MSKKIDPNEPAFAFGFEGGAEPGLTKREWFAGMALVGCLASDVEASVGPEQAAEFSRKCADALIANLNDGED